MTATRQSAAPSRSVPTGGEITALYAICIAAALGVSALLVELTGGSATDVVDALIEGSLTKPGRWGTTIGTAIPLLLVALGTIVSTRASLVNIGQEGQLLVGAACAAYVSVHLGNHQGWPGSLVLLILLTAGIGGGAAWAGIAGVLRYRRGVPEVLSTLLLVAIATQLVAYGFRHESILLAPFEGQGTQVRHTLAVPDDVRLSRLTLFGNEIPTSALVAVALAIGVSVMLARTVWGFRLSLLGHNARAAQRSGVSATRTGLTALLVSGGFAGLAGAFMLVGGDFGGYRFSPGFAVNIGWTGLLVALVARGRALPAVAFAFVFACLRTGSGFLAATGVERRITDVVQALLVLALLIPPAVLHVRERRRNEAAARARE